MTADSTWQPWAEQGWTLHQAPGGWVRAVNVNLGQATASAPYLTILVKRLERGMFNYGEFLAFKKRPTP